MEVEVERKMDVRMWRDEGDRTRNRCGV
jgi:hypothetical protein